MILPANKTKIICTIGPASESRVVMEQMLLAGMNVARINFSHGDFDSHERIIARLRKASKSTGRRLAVMADLPGPKMRIGRLAKEPIQLKAGDDFILSAEETPVDSHRVSISFTSLPEKVTPGDALYINDGYIELKVVRVQGKDICCKVIVGGELRSKKGVNLPGIDLGVSAFTERDRECLKFAMGQGLDAVSQSFVERGADIDAVRDAAKALGHSPFIIAKIERSRARDNLEEILNSADGIMIARGDLGVEIPIEGIAIAQKYMMQQANLLGKPVITATQMLESMSKNTRPTRAEATDVANAILDGTDCVMLSGESAMGRYPVEAVRMLTRIAAATEPHRPGLRARKALMETGKTDEIRLTDLIASSVEAVIGRVTPALVIVPTCSGATARSVSRYGLPVWVMGVSSRETTCRRLQFTYGVYPVHEPDHPEDWKAYTKKWFKDQGIRADLVVLTEGPSSKHPEMNHRMEIIDLRHGHGRDGMAD